MEVFKYEIELTDDNDKDYYKIGIIVSQDEETAVKEVYDYYDKRTTDYVSHNVLLTKVDDRKGVVIEF